MHSEYGEPGGRQVGGCAPASWPRLATETPAEPGDFRVFNQMTESMTVGELAKTVATTYPDPVEIAYVDNPRVEAEEHHYKVTHRGLVELDLEPHLLSDTLITSLFEIAQRYKHRVDRAALYPRVDWRQTINPARTV